MKKAALALIAAMALTSAAIASDQKSVAWTNDCTPAGTSAKWQATLHFDGEREPETAAYDHGMRAQTIGEQACRRTATAWNPERVARVDVTRTSTGETVTIHCS